MENLQDFMGVMANKFKYKDSPDKEINWSSSRNIQTKYNDDAPKRKPKQEQPRAPPPVQESEPAETPVKEESKFGINFPKFGKKEPEIKLPPNQGLPMPGPKLGVPSTVFQPERLPQSVRGFSTMIRLPENYNNQFETQDTNKAVVGRSQVPSMMPPSRPPPPQNLIQYQTKPLLFQNLVIPPPPKPAPNIQNAQTVDDDEYSVSSEDSENGETLRLKNLDQIAATSVLAPPVPEKVSVRGRPPLPSIDPVTGNLKGASNRGLGVDVVDDDFDEEQNIEDDEMEENNNAALFNSSKTAHRVKKKRKVVRRKKV